jgi:hypothetical protein
MDTEQVRTQVRDSSFSAPVLNGPADYSNPYEGLGEKCKYTTLFTTDTLKTVVFSCSMHYASMSLFFGRAK